MSEHKPKIVIGRLEHVWVVATDQKKVPARIDTGARTTAVWASDVREHNGQLTWKFLVMVQSSTPVPSLRRRIMKKELSLRRPDIKKYGTLFLSRYR